MTDLADQHAPSLAELAALAQAALARMPERFRALCGNVAIHVADFAEEETLAELGIDDAFELTGLYEGVDLKSGAAATDSAGPTHVHLYRRPILDEWADAGDIALGDLVAHVLVHEIGHHFGLSDDDMHAIEKAAG
jgi:predicted Zn-dependent protease with MMP-like domain